VTGGSGVLHEDNRATDRQSPNVLLVAAEDHGVVMVGVVNEPADSGPRSIYTNRRFTTTANAVVFCPEEF